jgi:chromosome segregation ATPase
MPPADFVAARAERAAAAKDKATAKAITALRRPTVAAWAINRLARDDSPELAEALDLGDRLREAQQQLHGSELRRLDQRRRELVNALTKRASKLAGGLANDAEIQVRNTLTAAMADPDMAAQVREGRLTKALEYSGFGPLSDAVPVHDDLADRREQRRERRLAEAREALSEAEDRVDSHEAEVKDAKKEQDARAKDVEDLKAELRQAERAAQQAAKSLDKARQRLGSAEDAVQNAKAAVAELES